MPRKIRLKPKPLKPLPSRVFLEAGMNLAEYVKMWPPKSRLKSQAGYCGKEFYYEAETSPSRLARYKRDLAAWEKWAKANAENIAYTEALLKEEERIKELSAKIKARTGSILRAKKIIEKEQKALETLESKMKEVTG